MQAAIVPRDGRSDAGPGHRVVPFIDSHAHLADSAFDPDRDAVIARARIAGAQAVVCIGESLDAADRARRIADAYPGFAYFTAGVHPHEAGPFDPTADVERLTAFAASGAVAIGECGLDYHYDHAPRPMQRRAFAAQLRLARDLNRPVVVHTRDAEDDTRAMMTEAAAAGVRGVLHCFTGSLGLAEAGLVAGWSLSFSGIITFKNWGADTLLRMVPDERLLVESDAPYLAPVPYRARRNEPAFVVSTLERLAVVRGVGVHPLGERTSENARNLFRLVPS